MALALTCSMGVQNCVELLSLSLSIFGNVALPAPESDRELVVYAKASTNRCLQDQVAIAMKSRSKTND